MVRNYRSGPDWIPGIVTKELGSTILVCVENGQIWKRHIDQIKLLGMAKLTLTTVRNAQRS